MRPFCWTLQPQRFFHGLKVDIKIGFKLDLVWAGLCAGVPVCMCVLVSVCVNVTDVCC